MRAGKRGIELDPNDWYDNLYWFEDEPDVFEFMEENEDKIDIMYNLRINK